MDKNFEEFFDEIWTAEKGATSEELDYVEERVGYHFSKEMRELYRQADGFRAMRGDLYVSIWSLDEVISFYELYCDEVDGEYVFFASSGESRDGFAFEKSTNRVFCFPIDCGVEAEDKVLCAQDLHTLFEYWKSNEG